MVDEPTTRRRRTFRIAAALLPLAALLALEAVLRVAGFEHRISPPAYVFLNPEGDGTREQQRFVRRDDELFWRLDPAYAEPENVHVIAPTGYRSDFTAERPAGTQRVVCLGDSNTFGLYVDAKATWPAITEGLLRAEDRRVEVLNLGVPGYTSHQGLLLLRREVRALRPDAVVLAFGVFNDWVPACGRTDAEQTRRGLVESLRVLQLAAWAVGRAQEVPADTSGSSLAEIDTRDHEGARRVDPDDYAENLREMIDEVRAMDALPVLVALPLPKATLERNPVAARYAGITRDVGAREDVPVVDGWRVFEESGDGEARLFLDFCHARPAGHALIAKRLAEVLGEALR